MENFTQPYDYMPTYSSYTSLLSLQLIDELDQFEQQNGVQNSNPDNGSFFSPNNEKEDSEPGQEQFRQQSKDIFEQKVDANEEEREECFQESSQQNTKHQQPSCEGHPDQKQKQAQNQSDKIDQLNEVCRSDCEMKSLAAQDAESVPTQGEKPITDAELQTKNSFHNLIEKVEGILEQIQNRSEQVASATKTNRKQMEIITKVVELSIKKPPISTKNKNIKIFSVFSARKNQNNSIQTSQTRGVQFCKQTSVAMQQIKLNFNTQSQPNEFEFQELKSPRSARSSKGLTVISSARKQNNSQLVQKATGIGEKVRKIGLNKSAAPVQKKITLVKKQQINQTCKKENTSTKNSGKYVNINKSSTASNPANFFSSRRVSRL